MHSIRFLNADEVRRVTDMRAVIGCVESVYSQNCSGEAVVWPTTVYEFDPGHADMDIKSGYLRGAGIYGHKTVSWFEANASSGLPELSGVIVVYSAETGMPLGVLDAAYITGVRTGAAGAVGAKYLARPDPEVLAIIGSGNQAFFQAAAMLTQFGSLRKVTVCNPRSAAHAESFAASLPGRLAVGFGIDASGVEIRATCDGRSALADADVVITVTPSRSPVVKCEWVRPGTHFSCIGADMPGKQELEGEICAGARVFVDDMEHCVSSGEIELPIKQGLMSAAEVAGNIGELVLGKKRGRLDPDQITVFDATGMALLDIAAAKAALDSAEERGIGTVIEM